MERRAPARGAGPQDRHPYHRKFLRRRVRIRVEVQSELSFTAWTLNLSEDGLCFEIPSRIELDQEVGVWVYLGRSGHESPVHGRCRVVWCHPTDRGTRHGAQFLRFAEDGQARLASFLSGL
jgi:hypothetical protein